jgi:hypothetical protein
MYFKPSLAFERLSMNEPCSIDRPRCSRYHDPLNNTKDTVVFRADCQCRSDQHVFQRMKLRSVPSNLKQASSSKQHLAGVPHDAADVDDPKIAGVVALVHEAIL